MRILLAPSAYYPHVGGIEELTRQLALRFQDDGHQTMVLTNRWPDGVAPGETLDGVRVTRLQFPLPAARAPNLARFAVAAPAAAAVLIRTVRSFRPDVVHIIGAGPQSVYLTTLARFLGTRLIFTAQGELTFDANSAFGRSTTLLAALRRTLRTADAVTACSAYVLEGLSRVGQLPSGAVVIPNGVEPRDFARAPAPTATRPYVFAAGRLVPQKGFDVLLDAFASEDLSALDLVLAGDGPERDRLEARAIALGIGNRVRFPGALDRNGIAEALAAASAFALPSRGEPFGIALLEAMAAGVPSVATRAGGVTEFAEDEGNVLLVEPDDAAGLARALKRLATDDQLRSRLATSSRATAAALSWRSIAPRYARLYREVTDRTD